MRKLGFIWALLAVGLVASLAKMSVELQLPPRADPWPVSDDPACVEATRRPPDHGFHSSDTSTLDSIPAPALRFAELTVARSHRRVRMSGFLHVEFEHVALYASWEDASRLHGGI